ncbi:MAG: zinc-ribbon domain-containing protein [Clostridiales Family XIII bacterium]|jgi:hypothetical protein|nr:zinc-ribbon domain-containing protein [Clostridiales Family XIII bacterium]
MDFCPSCGAGIAPGQTFCSVCGAAQPAYGQSQPQPDAPYVQQPPPQPAYGQPQPQPDAPYVQQQAYGQAPLQQPAAPYAQQAYGQPPPQPPYGQAQPPYGQAQQPYGQQQTYGPAQPGHGFAQPKYTGTGYSAGPPPFYGAYPQPYNPANAAVAMRGFVCGIVGLVLGILCALPFFGIAAFVLGIIAIRSKNQGILSEKKVFAGVGFGLGIGAVVLGVIGIIFTTIFTVLWATEGYVDWFDYYYYW